MKCANMLVSAIFFRNDHKQPRIVSACLCCLNSLLAQLTLNCWQIFAVPSTRLNIFVTYKLRMYTRLNLLWATKVVETLFDIKALVLFYLHLALILWYPWTSNSMLCRCCGLRCLRNRKVNIALWEREGNFFQDAENRMSKHSKHFCRSLCSSVENLGYY